MSDWLSYAVGLLKASPPPGLVWTSHSLRSGPASAAKAQGWDDIYIKHYGGWSRNSDVHLTYIDPAVRPCAGSRFFFGWLLAPPADL